MHDLLVWEYSALFWSLNTMYRWALIMLTRDGVLPDTRYSEYTQKSGILSFSTSHPSSIHVKYIWTICNTHIPIRFIGRW